MQTSQIKNNTMQNKSENPQKERAIAIDVYTLGLIYNLDVEGKKARIRMTFTSPMCPYGPQLVMSIKQEFISKGFSEPEVEITFNPPWEPSQDLREALGV